MKHKFLLLFFAFITCYSFTYAQGGWVKKTANTSTLGSTQGVTANGKGYISDNIEFATDIFEYDATTDSWQVKTRNTILDGSFHSQMVAANGKIYQGLGVDTHPRNTEHYFYNSFFEYDPATNAWKSVASFPGEERSEGLGFSIGNKIYFGLGGKNSFKHTSTKSEYKKDWWEYDINSNTWTRKADFPIQGKDKHTFTIGSKGYVGVEDNAVLKFWEYNPTTDQWAKIADYPGTKETFYLWDYDPTTNSWGHKVAIPSKEAMLYSFTINGKLYAGRNAYNKYVGNLQYVLHPGELWMFDSDAPATPVVTEVKRTGGQSILLTWQDLATVEDGYVVQRFDNVDSTITTIDSLVANTTTYTDNSVQIGKIYTYRLLAYNSLAHVTTQFKSEDFPIKPTNLLVNKIAPTQIKLTWADQDMETGFVIERYDERENGYKFLDSVSANTINYTDAGVTDSVQYAYRVKAYTDFVQSVWSEEAFYSFTILRKAERKTAFGGTARKGAIGFSIGTKAYIGLGVERSDYQKDFWEYNSETNTWTQKADFTQGKRANAIAFVIGTKGYVGLGSASYNTYAKDFWAYDPATNSWQRLADFGGEARHEAYSFVINNKGYIGAGKGASGYFSDLWEYNPVTDSWQVKTTKGLSGSHLVGFSYKNKGVVLPTNGDEYAIYDSVNDKWEKKKTNIPVRLSLYYGKAGFMTNNRCYVITNMEGRTLWEYNPFSDTWSKAANLDMLKLFDATGFAIGNTGYLGVGYHAVGGYQKALWAFTVSSGLVAPDQLTAIAQSSQAVKLDWVDNSVHELGFVIERRIKGESAFQIIDSVQADVTTYLDNKLVANTSYQYRIKSFNNQVVSTYSSVVEETTPNDNYSGVWEQKQGFPGARGDESINFSIDELGYIGSTEGQGELWAYNPATNVWTQKANYVGKAPEFAFTIGKKAYVGGSTDLQFWEYDVVANAWTKKANLSFYPFETSGFSIGNKGYVSEGGRNNGNSGFWEYDPTIDQWTSKASFPGAGRYQKIGFAINGKVYLGLGLDDKYIGMLDFWEYNPSTDQWIQKHDFPGKPRSFTKAIATQNRGFIAGGKIDAMDSNEFWEYIPEQDTWKQRVAYAGAGFWALSGFSINNNVYVGAGYQQKDFWMYAPLSAPKELILENNQVLSWRDMSANEQGFIIEYSHNNEVYQVLTTTDKDQINYNQLPSLNSGVVSYRVRAYNEHGVSGFSNVVTRDFVSGTSISTLQNNIRIYSNPTQGVFQIGTEKAFTEKVILTLYGVNGGTIYQKEWDTTQSSKQAIDIRSQTNGIYWLKISTVKGSITKKILKH